MPQDNFQADSEPIRVAGYDGSRWSALRAGLTSAIASARGILNAVVMGVSPSGKAVPLAVTESGALGVSASVDTTGLATAAGQTTSNASLSSIDTKMTTVADTAFYAANKPASQAFVALTLTGSAQQLADHACAQGVTLYNASASATVYVGGAGVDNTGWPLGPGEKEFFPVTNSNTLYVLGTNAQKLNYRYS